MIYASPYFYGVLLDHYQERFREARTLAERDFIRQQIAFYQQQYATSVN